MNKPSLIDRIRYRIKPVLSRVIYKEENFAMSELGKLSLQMLQYGPDILTKDALEKKFAETFNETYWDSELLDLTMTLNRDWDIISGENTGSGRVRAIQQAQILYLTDPVTGHIIELWTDFGFGQKVDVSPREEAAKPIWKEFFTAYRNKSILGQKEIQRLSELMLNDGEVIFVFFVDTTTGEVTIRLFPATQITEIITDPEDKDTKMIYKREYRVGNEMKTKYYRDWLFEKQPQYVIDRTVLAFNKEHPDQKIEGSNIAVEKKSGEVVEVGTLSGDSDDAPSSDIVIMWNARKVFKRRGYPLMTAGIPWATVYQNFVSDRATVQRSRATYVEKVSANNAGQRAIDRIKGVLQSSLATSDGRETNPRPSSGSTFIENENAVLSRLSMTTGGADAEKDGSIIIAMLGLAGGVYPHYLGFGQAFRLATATSMEKPTLKRLERYKTIWSAIWSDMVNLVLMMHEKYNPGAEFDKVADINLDSVIDADVDNLISSIEMIITVVNEGMFDFRAGFEAIDQLVRKILQIFSVEEVSTIIQSNTWPVDRKTDSAPPPDPDANDEVPPAELGELTEGEKASIESIKLLVEKLKAENARKNAKA